MYSNKLYSPLRYPGGKARFAPLIADVIRANKLDGGSYLEPYAGGAGVALALLFDGVVAKIHINDADPAVSVFWKCAITKPRKLIDMVANAELTMDAWHHWRGVMLGSEKATEIERAFATLFLNRTNRSGILKGGVIGGKAQLGEYRLDARFMRDEICDRLTRIGKHSALMEVHAEDAHMLLSRCQDFLPTKSLIYCDPPYYVKGEGLYRNFYQHTDHVKIANLLKKKSFRRNWVVSYDNALEIREMYAYAKSFTYGLNYTAQRRYVGSEVMFFSDRLVAPESLPVRDAA